MKKSIKGIAICISLLTCIHLAGGHSSAEPAGEQGCRVVREGKHVELRSPLFVFRLDTTAGLRAQSWENRLTGRKISLGAGAELELDIGLPGEPLETPKLQVIKVPVNSEASTGEAVFKLSAEKPKISARVTYRWEAKQPVLRKFVVITNEGDRELNRLLNVRLGDYRTDAELSGGVRGFPAYLDDEFFTSLAHPAGYAAAEKKDKGHICLRQYPGAKLPSGEKFQCMEAVYGVGEAGSARKVFLTHLRGRMRRVVRGHDKPYAIFSAFGAQPEGNWKYDKTKPEVAGNYNETEPFVLDMIAKVAEGQRDSGCHFDLFSVDFWVDRNGDLKAFDPVRFPNGLTNIRQELEKLGTAPGLWIDSSYTHWSIGGNPAVRRTFTHDPSKKGPRVPRMCRATEPIKSMYTAAFCHHIRENGARLLKFDNLYSVCNNPNHGHLPGIYSTEPIQNAVIEFFQALDKECPDVFLMAYWGYRSPWWLLHVDTLFDSGIHIEAASPSDLPTLYARDSVTQKLDQAQRHAKDVPPLGKDSLGIWLSDWAWNSQIGKERWQEGFVIDICRGSLLAQPWSDTPWLSPPERKQMAEFIALLKARPECFGNPRFILGDPRKNEPYGYCCTDGKRAFLALNNCAWKDSSLPLKLNSAWGLPDGRAWDLYRWYPEPARLEGDADAFGEEASISLRPFEVVLLEVVPRGERPSLSRAFEAKPIPSGFPEASRSVEITVDDVRDKPKRQLVVNGEVPRSTTGGTLVVTVEMSRGSGPWATRNVGEHLLAQGKLVGRSGAFQPVLGKRTYPAPWQAWRIAVEPSAEPRPFELSITSKAIANVVRLACKAYFIPHSGMELRMRESYGKACGQFLILKSAG